MPRIAVYGIATAVTAGLVLWLGRPAVFAVIGLAIVCYCYEQTLHRAAAAQPLAAVSTYRHRIANGLQQAIGWLQLQKPARALVALSTMQEQMLLESALWRTEPPALVERLVPLLQEAEDAGLALPWYGDPCEQPTLPLQTVLLAQAKVQAREPFALCLRLGHWRIAGADEAQREVAAARDKEDED